MGKELLIVSPHFPPDASPPSLRARLFVQHFREFGWEPHILAVNPQCTRDVQDPLLVRSLPSNLPVTYAKALSQKYSRFLGGHGLAWRSFFSLKKSGEQLLKEKKFDLIYFVTAEFLLMALGPFWRKKFGISYCLDFIDPWVNDYHARHPEQRPPGGRIKYGFHQFLARTFEPGAVRLASHITAVSPAYPEMFMRRYPLIPKGRFSVLPYGVSEKDFELLKTWNVKQRIFDPGDGKRHWVYVGRGGADMRLALRILFGALKILRGADPMLWNGIQLHFVGTSYAGGKRAVETVKPVAEECGVGDLVEEYTGRIPYFEALQVLKDSDGILLIGSDEPGYSASKIYPCVLARRPLLAIFHEKSPVVDILRRLQAGKIVPFSEKGSIDDFAGLAVPCLKWLMDFPKGQEADLDWSVFQEYTAHSMTRKLCESFDRCLLGRR